MQRTDAINIKHGDLSEMVRQDIFWRLMALALTEHITFSHLLLGELSGCQSTGYGCYF